MIKVLSGGTKLRFLKEIYENRPGSQTIHAFNRSLGNQGVLACTHQPNQYFTNIARELDNRNWLRNIIHIPRRAYIVALMWPKSARLFPVGFWGEIIPLCFDCWPDDYDQWERLFRRNSVRIAFFTANQSRHYFKNRIPGMECIWLPEAADPVEYPFTIPLRERTIEVMELGRRSEPFHQAVTGILEQNGVKHVYATEDNKRVFATRQELMDAWSQTKISVCFPKSMTNVAGAGGVETVTFRYFESISSRCLVLGHCPRELYDIFGYNPVIEIDENDPGGQLLSLLENIDEYQPLVEKNHARMCEVGSWDCRVEQMLNVLETKGYRIGRTA